MTALRHPNVILFMAASIKPPHLWIVMEYMALGSLFSVNAIFFSAACFVISEYNGELTMLAASR